MGKTQRGIRDGSGPYAGSYRKTVEGQSVGRRIEAGETCPVAKTKTETKTETEVGETKFINEDTIDKIKFWGN